MSFYRNRRGQRFDVGASTAALFILGMIACGDSAIGGTDAQGDPSADSGGSPIPEDGGSQEDAHPVDAAPVLDGTNGASDAAAPDASTQVDASPALPSWTSQFGTPKADSIRSVSIDSVGNVYSIVFPAEGGVSVRKADGSGNALWSRQIGGLLDRGDFSEVRVDAADNVMVSGSQSTALNTTPVTYDTRAFLTKYDGSGNVLWSTSFGTSVGKSDTAIGLALDKNGDTLVTGASLADKQPTSGPYTGGWNLFLRRFNSTGTELWSKTLTSTSVTAVAISGTTTLVAGAATETQAPQVYTFDAAGVQGKNLDVSLIGKGSIAAMHSDSAGNVYMTGSTAGTLPNEKNAGDLDGFVLKYDSALKLVWGKQFGTKNWDSIAEITADGSGNVYVTGTVTAGLDGQPALGLQDAFLRKFDASGNAVFTRQFGTTSYDAAMAIAARGAAIVVGGWTYGTLPGQTHIGDYDAFLRKFDANGN